jgi:hypothetical protein
VNLSQIFIRWIRSSSLQRSARWDRIDDVRNLPKTR